MPYARVTRQSLEVVHKEERMVDEKKYDVEVVPKGESTELQKEYLAELENVVTPAYIGVVKKAFPWLSGLTVSRDDGTREWVAVFERDGNKEACELAGTTFPQFPDDFVKCIKKHLSALVDRSKMEALGDSLAEFEVD